MKKWPVIVFSLMGIVIILLIVLVIGKQQQLDESKLQQAELESELSQFQEKQQNENQQEEVATLEEENDDLKQELEYLQQINTSLEKEKEDLKEAIEDLIVIDDASIYQLKKKGIEDINVIKESLMANNTVIPFDGVLGGTMQFTQVYVLNDIWAYGQFDDGHILGYGLFKYTIDDGQNISWEVVEAMLD